MRGTITVVFQWQYLFSLSLRCFSNIRNTVIIVKEFKAHTLLRHLYEKTEQKKLWMGKLENRCELLIKHAYTLHQCDLGWRNSKKKRKVFFICSIHLFSWEKERKTFCCFVYYLFVLKEIETPLLFVPCFSIQTNEQYFFDCLMCVNSCLFVVRKHFMKWKQFFMLINLKSLHFGGRCLELPRKLMKWTFIVDFWLPNQNFITVFPSNEGWKL